MSAPTYHLRDPEQNDGPACGAENPTHLTALEGDAAIAGAWCPWCKVATPDPIVVLDLKGRRVVFACPGCSIPELRARWEREGFPIWRRTEGT